MGKKYIIELEEPEMFDDRKFYTCSQMPWWAVSENIVENLTPYTEPDLEQVKKEAYGDGYKTAKVQCNIQAEKDLREVGERHYQKGLSDAWEAARKIANMPYGEEEKAFGSGGWTFIEKHTASEAIEKLKAYEQEQEAIQVGDEVISPDGKGVVTEISDRTARIMFSSGLGYMVKSEDLTKTGRHFPEIAAVFEKMRGEKDG